MAIPNSALATQSALKELYDKQKSCPNRTEIDNLYSCSYLQIAL